VPVIGPPGVVSGRFVSRMRGCNRVCGDVFGGLPNWPVSKRRRRTAARDLRGGHLTECTTTRWQGPAQGSLNSGNAHGIKRDLAQAGAGGAPRFRDYLRNKEIRYDLP